MKVSYSWLSTYFDKKFFGKNLPNHQKLAEILSVRGFEIENTENILNDYVFDIKILPDRAHYALSHRGIASEISAMVGLQLKNKINKNLSISSEIPLVKIIIDEPKFCRRYVARLIKNVTISNSSSNIRKKLEAIGARAINSVVDATNFVMYDVGQPIHAFDADKVNGNIHVRFAKVGEKITLLDDREVELISTDLIITDDMGTLAIAGVKGGKKAEITKDTKNIIIESANFDPASVRKTSTRLDIRNDSSKRFENEITPNLAGEAIELVTGIVMDSSRGSLLGAITDVYPEPVKEWTINCETSFICEILGIDIKDEEIVSILESLNFKVTRNNQNLSITPPLDRLDIKIAEDVADEVGRLYGYEKIESKQTPEVPNVPMDKTFYWSEKTKNILIDLSFSETLLYTLVSKGSFEISYPLASDKSALRESLSPKLFESLTINARNADMLGLETIKIFEIGKIFPETGEKSSLCVGVTQVKKKKNINSESILKETLLSLEKSLNLKLDGQIENSQNGSVVELDFDLIVSKLNEVESLSDLNFKTLSKDKSKDKKYTPFSRYPFIVRDIALFVPSETKENEIIKTLLDSLSKTAKNLLVKGPDLFDKFSKNNKTSYAFRMIFQSFEKTLSDDEINAFMSDVYKAVKERGFDVR